MDKIPKLGNLITDEQGRDAVHIAVAPVIAGEILGPGDHIGFIGNAYTVGTIISGVKPIGIVDPCLTKPIMQGQKFYMFLYPNTITSLRHEWTHPEFEREDEIAELEPTFFKLQGTADAEKWISDFAENIGSDYDEIMYGAAEYLGRGEYLVRGGTFEGESIPDEFWKNYEIVTKKQIPESDRGTFLSCSC
jgi:hypothetical protein